MSTPQIYVDRGRCVVTLAVPYRGSGEWPQLEALYLVAARVSRELEASDIPCAIDPEPGWNRVMVHLELADEDAFKGPRRRSAESYIPDAEALLKRVAADLPKECLRGIE